MKITHSALNTPSIYQQPPSINQQDNIVLNTQNNLSMNVLALMAALIVNLQDNSITNSESVKISAKKVMSNYPHGAHPRWLDEVSEIANGTQLDNVQPHDMQLKLLISLQALGPIMDTVAAGNNHHHFAHKNAMKYA